MPAPIASNIELPDDSGNAGKRVRTITKTVSGVSVLEHFMIPDVALTTTGKYFFSSTQQAVSATIQDGTSTAFFWFQVPVAATVTALLRNATIDFNTSSTTVAPTCPVISFSKFTFTGTASGTNVTAVPYQTAGVTNQMIVRTAVTGMTVTLAGQIGQAAVPTVLTGVGQVWAEKHILDRNPIAYTRGHDLELGPGEGMVVWQSVAGTATDPRRFGLQVEWLEIDLS